MQRTKKTEKIEVRLTPETKQHFLETCEQQEKAASVVIRDLIEEYVRRLHIPILAKPMEMARKAPLWGKLSACAAALVGSVMLVAFPSQANERAQWEIRFDRFDDDGDGVLLRNEFGIKYKDSPAARANPEQVAMAKQAANVFYSRRFQEIDTDQDLIISKKEFHENHVLKSTEEFKGYDADENGAITLEEFVSPKEPAKAAHQTRIAFASVRYDRDKIDELRSQTGAGKLSVLRTSATVSQAKVGQVFRTIDTNDDGKIGLDEYLAL